jgi:hypothetical protein
MVDVGVDGDGPEAPVEVFAAGFPTVRQSHVPHGHTHRDEHNYGSLCQNAQRQLVISCWTSMSD